MSRTRVCLLTALYMGGYGWLRATGEIGHVRPLAGAPDGRHCIGAGWDKPRWRQQAWRALYAPLMVMEEEGRRLGDGGGPAAGRAASFAPGDSWEAAFGAAAERARGLLPVLPPASAPMDGEGLAASPHAPPEAGEAIWVFSPVTGMVPLRANVRAPDPAEAPAALPEKPEKAE